MNTITKHTNIRKITALGITGAAASALIIGGFVAPAQAFDGDSTSTTTSTDSSSEQNRLDVIGDLFNLSGNDSTGNGVLGNDTSVGGVGNGGILGGGVVNGPLVDDSLNNDIGDVASGNEVGNDASVGTGNDVVAPIEAPVTAPVDAGNGTDVGTDVGGVDVENIDGSVDSIVNDVLGDLGLGLGR